MLRGPVVTLTARGLAHRLPRAVLGNVHSKTLPTSPAPRGEAREGRT